MEREAVQESVLSEVGRALMDKGAGYSVGMLVAELEGDGIEEDPYTVRDRHFLQDVEEVNEWRTEPRDLEEVEALLAVFAEYWNEYPDERFCQVVCNAHAAKNGMRNFEDDTHYEDPLDELTDEQLTDYLERQLDNE